MELPLPPGTTSLAFGDGRLWTRGERERWARTRGNEEVEICSHSCNGWRKQNFQLDFSPPDRVGNLPKTTVKGSPRTGSHFCTIFHRKLANFSLFFYGLNGSSTRLFTCLWHQRRGENFPLSVTHEARSFREVASPSAVYPRRAA